MFKQIRQLITSGQIDAVIIEDYAKGVLDETFAQAIINICKYYKIPIVLDPNPKNQMKISGITTMTPNRHEAYMLTGIQEAHELEHKPPLEDKALHRVGHALLKKYDMDFLIVTLGKDGLIIYSKNDDGPLHMPTRAIEVFDVSGAGDTFVSVFTTYYSKIRNIRLCAEIANVAAGIVVEKRGAATVTIQEIEQRAKELQQRESQCKKMTDQS